MWAAELDLTGMAGMGELQPAPVVTGTHQLLVSPLSTFLVSAAWNKIPFWAAGAVSDQPATEHILCVSSDSWRAGIRSDMVLPSQWGQTAETSVTQLDWRQAGWLHWCWDKQIRAAWERGQKVHSQHCDHLQWSSPEQKCKPGFSDSVWDVLYNLCVCLQLRNTARTLILHFI